MTHLFSKTKWPPQHFNNNHEDSYDILKLIQVDESPDRDIRTDTQTSTPADTQTHRHRQTNRDILTRSFGLFNKVTAQVVVTKVV